jgi:hypothetical protein
MGNRSRWCGYASRHFLDLEIVPGQLSDLETRTLGPDSGVLRSAPAKGERFIEGQEEARSVCTAKSSVLPLLSEMPARYRHGCF